MAKKSSIDRPSRNHVGATELFSRLHDALACKSSVRVDVDSITRCPFPGIPDGGVSKTDFGAIRDFRDAYLLKEVLRKYPAFEMGIDTSAVAITAFKADEVTNAETNERLNLPISKEFVPIIEMARRKIGKVLGRFDVNRMLEFARHGPGSTTRLRRREASIGSKLTGRPTVHMSALAAAEHVLSLYPGWAWRVDKEFCDDLDRPFLSSLDNRLEVTDYDMLACVPKSARTDRIIGIPPDMSVFLQLGVGGAIRERLYYAGINLNDQSINQGLAREGSISGQTATLDMKSASQSVTQVLVFRLLDGNQNPYVDSSWFKILEGLRVESCRLPDGTSHEYELFSAMGNGYTFELESLLFWTIADSTRELFGIPGHISVYGDDLIVPSELVPLVEEVFGYCGFRFNMDKSFWTKPIDEDHGVFRESCGKHYLAGFDVTPFYVDGPLYETQTLLTLANNLVRWAKLPVWGLDGRLYPVWNWVVSQMTAQERSTAIPFGDEDDGLILPFDLACPRVAKLGEARIPPVDNYWDASYEPVPRSQYGSNRIGYRARVLRPEFKSGKPGDNSVKEDMERDYLVWLYQKSTRGFKPPEKSVSLVPKAVPPFARPEGILRGYAKGTRVVRNWNHPGSWVGEGLES